MKLGKKQEKIARKMLRESKYTWGHIIQTVFGKKALEHEAGCKPDSCSCIVSQRFWAIFGLRFEQ